MFCMITGIRLKQKWKIVQHGYPCEMNKTKKGKLGNATAGSST